MFLENVNDIYAEFRNYKTLMLSPSPAAGGVAGQSNTYQVNFQVISWNDLVSLSSTLARNPAFCTFFTVNRVKCSNLNTFSSSGWFNCSDWYCIEVVAQKSFIGYLGDSTPQSVKVGYDGFIANNSRLILVASYSYDNPNIAPSSGSETSVSDVTIETFDATVTNSILNSIANLIHDFGNMVYQLDGSIKERITLLSANLDYWGTELRSYLRPIHDSVTQIPDILWQFYNLFNERFSDLDLDYASDNEFLVSKGGQFSWSEGDRGLTGILGNDIGTLEVTGFPDLDGYIVDHDLGGGITITRNDGTFFPNSWQLTGGTVSMPTITTAVSSISVSAPVGTVISVAGNSYTFNNSSDYSVNVEFGTYTLNISYTSGGQTYTQTKQIVVDGYNDYHADVEFDNGALTVSIGSSGSFTAGTSNPNPIICSCSIIYDGVTHSNGSSFSVQSGSSITLTVSSSRSSVADLAIWVNGSRVAHTTNSVSYTLSSVSQNLTISYYTSQASRGYNIVTSGSAPPAGLSEPTVTITPNPGTETPLTIASVYRPSDSTTWVCYDSDGVERSFSAASNLALNRSFVTQTYTSVQLAALTNFPTGTWDVSWSGDSEYITIQFETYSKFFKWLNTFLVNFRDTLYTKIENISVSASGDVIVSGQEYNYTDQLDTIISQLSDIDDDLDELILLNMSTLDDDGTTVKDAAEDGFEIYTELFKWLWNNTVKGAFEHADVSDLDGLLDGGGAA